MKEELPLAAGKRDTRRKEGCAGDVSVRTLETGRGARLTDGGAGSRGFVLPTVPSSLHVFSSVIPRPGTLGGHKSCQAFEAAWCFCRGGGGTQVI